MLPFSVILVDRQSSLVSAWSEAFATFENVEVVEGDFFAHDAEAMVSPANSFGIMDGGLDRLIRAELGGGVQTAVQSRIVQKYHGEMPVGTAEVIVTGHTRWPFLIVAPTMRIPENVAGTLNAYLAFRAVLLAVMEHNRSASESEIKRVLCPGMATGIGAMSPRRCAAQMRIAYDQVAKPARIPSFSMIHDLHLKMRSAL